MNNINEIKEFTLKILDKLGAELEFITPDVFSAAFFGENVKELGEKVYLSFMPVPPEIENEINTVELIVPGSDFLEKLISMARKRGGGGQRVFLKKFYSPDEELPLKFFSVELESLQKIPHYRTFMEFNFRVTFLTDEKIESLYSVYIDEDGNSVDLGMDNLKDNALLSGPEETITHSGGIFSVSPEKIYEKARVIVSEKIQPQVETIEKEQEEHLSKSVARLEAYYTQQKDYVKKRHKEEAEPLLVDLNRELKQKKDELIEKHILKIGVSLINFREVSVPYAGYQAILLKGERKGTVHFKRDLLKGIIHLPSCSSCKKEISSVTLCSEEGHILGECCTYHCSRCYAECCDICRPGEVCHICNEKICEDCASICNVCRKTYCYEKHGIPCGKCGENICPHCTVKCEKCSKDFCPPHTLLCSYCNRKFCTDHSAKCTKCHKTGCCDHGNPCPQCGDYICKSCGSICTTCEKKFCNIHTGRCNYCKKAFCSEHLQMCKECGKYYCRDHSRDCPGCGFLTCDYHFKKCSLCDQSYCRTCGNKKKKENQYLCKGCKSLKKYNNIEEVAAIFGPHLTSLGKIPLPNLKRWKRGETEHYFIFTASRFFSSYLFVIDKRDGGLVFHKSLGFKKAILALLGK